MPKRKLTQRQIKRIARGIAGSMLLCGPPELEGLDDLIDADDQRRVIDRIVAIGQTLLRGHPDMSEPERIIEYVLNSPRTHD